MVRIALDHMGLVASQKKYLVIAGIYRMLLGAGAVMRRLAPGKYLISRDCVLARFAATGMGVSLFSTFRGLSMCVRGLHEHRLTCPIALAEERPL